MRVHGAWALAALASACYDPTLGGATPAPPDCGDGVLDEGETCDDGDDDEADICPPSCRPARCGDGYRRAAVEACDDGNLEPDDGCTATCVACDGAADARLETADGSCLLRHDGPIRWFAANDACTGAGARVAVLDSDAATAEALQLITEPTSIGLRYWSSRWEWVTGHEPTVTRWASGEPSCDPDCSQFRAKLELDGTWSVVASDAAHPFLCQRFQPWRVAPDGHAYRTMVAKMSWAAAATACEAEAGAHLVTLAGPDEMLFVQPLFEAEFSWIGASDEAVEGVFTWITDESFSFTNWGAGEPGGGVTENCVRSLATLEWVDAGCSDAWSPLCEAE